MDSTPIKKHKSQYRSKNMTKKRSEVFNKKIKICLTYSTGISNFHSIHVKKQKFRAFHLLLKLIHSENGNYRSSKFRLQVKKNCVL